jgi:hypothetical protein
MVTAVGHGGRIAILPRLRRRLRRRSNKTSRTISFRPILIFWQKLHLGLAAIAVLGWSLAYTVLTRGIDTPQDIARAEDAGTKVTVSLATPDTALSNPAGR